MTGFASTLHVPRIEQAIPYQHDLCHTKTNIQFNRDPAISENSTESGGPANGRKPSGGNGGPAMSEGTAGWCESCRVTDYLSSGGIPLAGWGIVDIRKSQVRDL